MQQGETNMINFTLDDLDCMYEVLKERRDNNADGTLREDLLFTKLDDLMKQLDDMMRKKITKEHLEEVLPVKKDKLEKRKHTSDFIDKNNVEAECQACGAPVWIKKNQPMFGILCKECSKKSVVYHL